MKKKIALLVTLILVINLISACAPVAKEPEPAKPADNQEVSSGGDSQDESEKMILRAAVSSEPTNLDNGDGVDGSNTRHKGQIFEGLIRVFPNDTIKPGTAKSWELSDDGLTYTFYLREGAMWSDGKPVTAHDFEYAIKRLVDPSPEAPNGGYSWMGFYIKNGYEFNQGECDSSEMGVVALDDYTLEITVVRRMPYFIDMLQLPCFYPVRKDYVEEYGKDYASSPDKIIGNGPFVLKEWNHEESLIYEKNDKFWDADNIAIDKLEVYIIGDNQTCVNMFEAGEIDELNVVPKELIDSYTKEGVAVRGKGARGWWISFNRILDRGEASVLLRNNNFRKAVSYAIDRQQIVDTARGDGSVPLTRLCPDLFKIIDTTWGEKYPYKIYENTAQPELAQEYFEKALEETGLTRNTLPIISLLIDDRDYNKVIAEILQSVFKTNFNLDVEIVTQTYKARWQNEMDGQYDMVLSTWAPDYNDPMTNLECFHSANKYNLYFGGLQNIEYDELIDLANSTDDLEVRAEAMFKAEKILLEELSSVPIYQTGYVWAQKKGLEGICRTTFGAVSPDWSRARYTN